MTNPGHDESAFARLLADADELLRLPVRAALVFAEQHLASFRSLATLLDTVLPADAGAEERLARAVQMPVETLRDLRQQELDPFQVPQRPLATLLRAVGIDEDTFTTLIKSDHDAFAIAAGGGMFRGAGGLQRDDDGLAEARAAWRALDLDDPQAFEDASED